ncbi:LysR family transcriptional regulator [Ferrimonas sediminicola]|uniref:LysR family transcriptional regulator n=1 Tax=Ferrimonas sediminicola TaxID=2569538 RepID=A0A4U1BEL4_9GAMM|nr:LysR family transcriptional regulator [Ferrimonas sediminicola]TKB48430.1 LysR family transcriptional regulator [Ferrimonas sediminicola]
MEIELTRHLPAFIAAARTRNFSAAARQLGVTPAAISKNIRTLEQGLGVRLFHRTTHSLSLTDEGAAFYNRVCPLVSELTEVLGTTRDLSGSPAGKLRVSLPYQYGRQYLIPLLNRFLTTYPEIELDMRFEDRVVDLAEEGIDVAIGNQVSEDANVIARPLAAIELQILASPQFLATHGTPEHPDDLERFNCVRYRSPSTMRLMPWYFRAADGSEFSRDNLKSNISVTSPELGMELAAKGVGIAMGAKFYSREFLDRGDLVPILTTFSTQRPPMMIYYATRRQLPAKTRVFIDYLFEVLGQPSPQRPATP